MTKNQIYLYLGIILISLFFIQQQLHNTNIFKFNVVHNAPETEKKVALLRDDVMITMRAAKQVLRHGFPRFNNDDLAQPSSSYLLPFVAATVFYFIPDDNNALLLMVALGAFCFYLSCIVSTTNFSLKSTVFFSLILVFNTTSYAFMFSSWEQLYQTLFIVLAWACVFSGRNNIWGYLLVGLFSALAILFRADSVFLLAPIYLYYLYQRQYQKLLLACIFLAIIGITYTYLQYSWFNTLLPTTVRLKADPLPPLSYSIPYAAKLFLHGSALTIIVALLFFFRKHLRRSALSMFCCLGIMASCLYAVLVSDFIAFGRMFMPALFTTVLLISTIAPVLIEQKIRFKHPPYHVKTIVIFIMIAATFISIINKLDKTTFWRRVNINVPKIEGYILTEDIKAALSPHDGVIGLFILGAASFNLMDYDIADFLGKADEAIAAIEPKGVVPGHNKWDFETSFSKWNIVVIPLRDVKAKTWAWRFYKKLADYLEERGNYTFCVPRAGLYTGLYIRNDALPKFHQCQQPY